MNITTRFIDTRNDNGSLAITYREISRIARCLGIDVKETKEIGEMEWYDEKPYIITATFSIDDNKSFLSDFVVDCYYDESDDRVVIDRDFLRKEDIKAIKDYYRKRCFTDNCEVSVYYK